MRDNELDPKNKATREKYWTIWATHVEGDSTVIETARTFDISRRHAHRVLRWCAEQLDEGGPETTIQALLWIKRKRLRRIREARAACMKTDDHSAAQGYLREERELESDIQELSGAKREVLELSGKIEHSGDIGINWLEAIGEDGSEPAADSE